MRTLEHVTLTGVDCIEADRLLRAAEICQREIYFGQVRMLTSLEHDHPSIVSIDPIRNIAAYSRFMVKDLNSFVETPFALVIQHDGFVLNPEAWREEFLAYDYIGAPLWINGRHIVGNGGFSLRSKKLLEVLQDDAIQIPDGVPEDLFICVTLHDRLEQRGIKFAPLELAQRFALEGNEKDGVVWTDQFGFHGLQWTDISRWLLEHPNEKIDNILDDETMVLKLKLES
jgi:Protein of unknown function (DUF5672)